MTCTSNSNSFVNAFLNYFANATIKIDGCLIDTTGGFGQHYIISKFVKGLSPYLMTIIVGHSPQTLDTAITKANKMK
ncbi:13007_t:CDS:2 [Funneliformis geosporum]|uniref:13007_t:CDS:1 n=1 Tax=Funneliformis geosporum TaxID=1117311 RepID=A0A9W4SWB4_9GLOM|nr:13007_t:CDS:2 [Funneliformis geosporum]